MTEHTKLPWRVEQDTDLIWGACNPEDPSTYGMGYSIVQGHSGVWCRGKPEMDEREANAAFIVKAVNNHDHLVTALVEIAAMDPKGIRADDLGRAARIAVSALRVPVSSPPGSGK